MAALDVWDEGNRRGLHLLCDGSSITGCSMPYYNPLAGSRLLPRYPQLQQATAKGEDADALLALVERSVMSELGRGTVELCFAM